jgi:hypothetical protein
LRAAGHHVQVRAPDRFDKDTLLVIWNRYGQWHQIADRVERGGGRTLVAENGFLGAGGSSPKYDVHPRGPRATDYYALAEGWHNGRGRSPSGGPERFKALGVELKPWSTDGKHILVAPNRSFGVGNQVMAPDWAQRASERLRKATSREVRIRPHPGNNAPRRPLSEDLKDCWAVVVWSSGVAVHALAAGIPAFIEAPFHILKGASASGAVDFPVTPERLPHFERLAWGQWTCEEIASGEPFNRLLAPAREAEKPTAA